MWQVEKPRGEVSGWLFGTIHALPVEAEWRTPTLERVLDRAGMLVVEVRDLDPQSLRKEFDRLARDCPCPPLASRLPPGKRASLDAALAKAGVSNGGLDGVETWAAALALARDGGGVDPANGADRVLIARFAGRPVEELEGSARQLAIFDRLPEDAQRAMLGEVLRSSREDHGSALRLARAWLGGDLETLEVETRRGLGVHPALQRALLLDRNHRWLPLVDPLLNARTRPLVAVGSAHLLGPDGLVAMLEAKGYIVRRIQ